jgi:hypothetical protein
MQQLKLPAQTHSNSWAHSIGSETWVNEHLWVFKKNNKWNCYGEGNYKTVGEIIDQYSTDPAVILNTVFADGSILVVSLTQGFGNMY